MMLIQHSNSDRLFNTQSKVLQADWLMLENNEKATIETFGCDGILETESIQQRLGAESLSAQTKFLYDQIFFLQRLLSCSGFCPVTLQCMA